MMKKALVKIAVWTLILSVVWSCYDSDKIQKEKIRKQTETHLQDLFTAAQRSGSDETDTENKTDHAESRIDDVESRIDDTESRIDDIENRISDAESIPDDTEDKTDDEDKAESTITENVNTDTESTESNTDDHNESESNVDDINNTESAADLTTEKRKVTDEFDYPGILSGLSLPSGTPIINLSRDQKFALIYLDNVMVKCPEKIVLVHPDEKIWNLQYDDIVSKWFWVESRTCNRYYINDVKAMVLSFQYNETDPQRIASMQHEVNTIANEIVAGMPNHADTWTKAKIIHDDLVKRLSYDHSVSLPHIRDIYCIVTGNAVCAGYADAFSYLMRWAGESAEVVSNEEHAWNRVTGYQGNDTYVDVTWDDPDFVSETTGTTEIKYDYFGLSYDTITKIPSHELDAGMRPTDTGTEEPFNYYERMGRQLNTYSYNEVLNIFANQYDNGETNLAIQFSNREAYQAAVHELFDNDCNVSRQMLSEIGYSERYYYWHNDSVLTIGLLL